MAGAAAGSGAEKYLTLFGVLAACCVLSANLGSRAWRTLSITTLRYSGFGAPVIAFAMAFAAGIAFPYLGFREVQIGGKKALEKMLLSAFLVALVFLISDINWVQNFIVVGSEVSPNVQIILRSVRRSYVVELLITSFTSKITLAWFILDAGSAMIIEAECSLTFIFSVLSS